jgi:hypothetical protein
MAKRDADEAVLADVSGEDKLSNEIDYENNDSIKSVLSDGERLFCELSIGSSDDIDVCGQPTGQDGDDPVAVDDSQAQNTELLAKQRRLMSVKILCCGI